MNPEILKILNKEYAIAEWYSYVKDILESEEFQKRKLFLHHEDSVYHHCILVSYKSFLLAKKTHANPRISAIAGLLHDFYPEAWQYSEELYKRYPECLNRKRGIKNLHGLVHAKKAALNYQKFYPNLVDERITNAIERHMFPLNIIPPKYKEGWLVTAADKIISFKTINVLKIPKYLGLKDTMKAIRAKKVD